jgi:hypothetical protein
MSENNIDLTATFNTSSASKSIKDFGDTAAKSLDGLNANMGKLGQSIDQASNKKINIDTSGASSSLNLLKTSLVSIGASIAAYFTVNAISGFFSTIIDESIDAQNNLNQLNGAMQRVGEYSTANVASMAAFANEMSRLSTVDDDVINGQLAIALNFTKSTESAQGLVKAAMDLSAATGISLDQAVEQLGKTLDGTAGRLNETVPALRGLSEEALKSGEGIKVVGEAFAGAALNQLNTFDGALTQAKNSFGNLAAAMGNSITQNPAVIQSINEVSNAFMGVQESIDGSTTASNSFINRGITALISGIRDLIPSLNAVSSFMKSISFLFEVMLKGVMSFVDGLKILGNSWLWLVGTMEGKKSALSDIDAAMKRMKERGDDLAKSLEGIGKNAFSDGDLKKFDEALKRIQDAAKKGVKIDAKLNIDDSKIKGLKDKINAEIGDIAKNIQIDLNVPEPRPGDTKGEDDLFTKNQLQEMGFEQWFTDLSEYLDGFILEFNEPKDNEQQKAWEGQFKEGASLPEPVELTKWEKIQDALTATASYIWNVLPGIKGIAYLGSKAVWTFYDTIRDNFELYSAAFGNGLKKSIDTLISSAAQGAEGAKGAVSSILSDLTAGAGTMIGAMFGPIGAQIGGAIGSTVGEMIKLATGDKKEIEAKLNQFFDAIPKVIETIVDNLPMIAEKVMGELPSIMIKLMEAIPKIIMAFANSMDELAEGLIMNSPALIQMMIELPWIIIKAATVAAFNIVKGMAEGISRLGKEKLAEAKRVLFEKVGAMSDSVAQFFDGIKNWIKSLSFNEIKQEVGKAILGLFKGIENFFNKAKEAFSLGLNLDFGEIFNKFKDGVGSLFSVENIEKLLDAIIEGFNSLFDKLKIDSDKLKVGGSTGSVLESWGREISSWTVGRNAKGGVVPQGFPDDSYPSFLTSNETIIPAETTPKLFDLISKLSSESGPSQSIDVSQIAESLRDSLNGIFSQQQSDGENAIDLKIVNPKVEQKSDGQSGDQRMFGAFLKGMKDILSSTLPQKEADSKRMDIKIPSAKLKNGGMIPRGYPDDSFPTMLSSNEIVVPDNTTSRLFSLIDKLASESSPKQQDSSGNDETNALLRQLISIMLNQDKTIEVKMERDTLAKAIVSLNKDNRRLA